MQRKNRYFVVGLLMSIILSLSIFYFSSTSAQSDEMRDGFVINKVLTQGDTAYVLIGHKYMDVAGASMFVNDNDEEIPQMYDPKPQIRRAGLIITIDKEGNHLQTSGLGNFSTEGEVVDSDIPSAWMLNDNKLLTYHVYNSKDIPPEYVLWSGTNTVTESVFTELSVKGQQIVYYASGRFITRSISDKKANNDTLFFYDEQGTLQCELKSAILMDCRYSGVIDMESGFLLYGEKERDGIKSIMPSVSFVSNSGDLIWQYNDEELDGYLIKDICLTSNQAVICLISPNEETTTINDNDARIGQVLVLDQYGRLQNRINLDMQGNIHKLSSLATYSDGFLLAGSHDSKKKAVLLEMQTSGAIVDTYELNFDQQYEELSIRMTDGIDGTICLYGFLRFDDQYARDNEVQRYQSLFELVRLEEN